MAERETTEKYRYKPAWLDRAKKSEGGGMPDSDGSLNSDTEAAKSKGELEVEHGNSAGVVMNKKG